MADPLKTGKGKEGTSWSPEWGREPPADPRDVAGSGWVLGLLQGPERWGAIPQSCTDMVHGQGGKGV